MRKAVYSLTGIYHIPESGGLGLAGGQGLGTPAPPASLSESVTSESLGLDWIVMSLIQ